MVNESAEREQAKAAREEQASRARNLESTAALLRTLLGGIENGDIVDVASYAMRNDLMLANADGTAIVAPSGTWTVVLQVRSTQHMRGAEMAARAWVEKNPASGLVVAPANAKFPPPPGAR